jgi:putative SOS response-associated peptidase YedK
LATLFDCSALSEAPPRYNVAPSQPVLAVRKTKEHPQRELTWLRWGLIPYWAADPKIAFRTINARSETAAKSPAFRSAFQERRCLIPADGFFEWKKDGKKKLPYYFRTKDGSPLALAGLWETWKDPSGQLLETCTILTTDADEIVQTIHPRMPAVLMPKDYDRWLDPEERKPANVQPLLKPFPPELLICYPVNPIANNATVDTPQCIEPAAEMQSLWPGAAEPPP